VRWLVFLGNRIHRLDHRAGRQHRVEIRPQCRKRRDRRSLSDGVEVTSFIKHEINVGEGLETAAESALRLSHSFGNGADLAAIRSEDDNDPIGFAEAVAPEDDPLVVTKPHVQERTGWPSVRRRPEPESREHLSGPIRGQFGVTHYIDGVALLEPNAVESFLAANTGWELLGASIAKTFVFVDFVQSMGFVTSVAILAEKAFHHPDIDIRWNKVTIVLSTHDEGGLTSKDLDLAGQIDGRQD